MDLDFKEILLRLIQILFQFLGGFVAGGVALGIAGIGLFQQEQSPWKALPMLCGLFLVALFNLDILGVKLRRPLR